MFSSKSLVCAAVLGVALLGGGCEFNWSVSTSSAPGGIEANELTAAVDPVIEQWKAQEEGTSIVAAMPDMRPVKVRWTTQKRTVTNDIGTGALKGEATLDDGRKIDLTANLKLDHNGWSLTDLSSGDTALLSDDWKAHAKLVRSTMTVFLECLKQKDFADFHTVTASAVQRQVTPAELKDLMKELLSVNVTGRPIAGLTPAFKVVTVTNQPELLRLVGTYKVGESVIYFDLKYVTENARWKPIGWQVNIGPAQRPAGAPASPEASRRPEPAPAATPPITTNRILKA